MPKRMLTETALAAFRRHGGILSTSDVLRLGIHARTLYALRDSGALEQLSRGLYRLADLPPLSNPDLVIVARRVRPSRCWSSRRCVSSGSPALHGAKA